MEEEALVRPPCSVDECEMPARTRGWCNNHYERWRRHGDPLAGRARYATPDESFAARTEWVAGCLVWTGATDPAGYGRIAFDSRFQGVHRFAWEQKHGPIPDGMVIDHMCWNPACVNVEHLRLATNAQNASSQSGAHADSRTGVRGVTRRANGWRAQVTTGKRTYVVGTFPTIEEAGRAAASRREEIFGEYAGH